MPNSTGFDLQTAKQQLEAAAAENRLSAGAVQNIRRWLTESRYAPYAEQVAAHLAAGQWQELDDAFWTIIPFGTGGRRGRMYPIGSNAINDRTIGESAQGLAEYVKQHSSGPRSAGLRDRLRHAAQLAPFRPSVCRNHGGGRLSGVLSGRLPQHARTVVPGALQRVCLRHHGHGQPQSAQRQRGEGVLVDRRTDSAAARQRRDRPRDERRPDPPQRFRPGVGGRSDRPVHRRGGCGFSGPTQGPDLSRSASAQDYLLAAARSGRQCGGPGHACRRFPGSGGLCRPCHTGWRLPQRAEPCG